jgi:hypothetical protein
MTELFDLENFKKHLSGYILYDCSFNKKDRYSFLLYEEKDTREELPRTRFLIILADQPMENRFGWYEIGHFSFATIARGITPAEYVAVDTRGNVYSSNAQRKGVEKTMHEVVNTKSPRTDANTRIVFTKVIRAAGQVYALGSYRKVFRRIGMDQWMEMGSEGRGVPLPKEVATDYMLADSLGFRDMSAFNANDMYAVGSRGDAWRFDGKIWRQCHIPTNKDLYTVCCAGDGHVYVTELNGTVWFGREDRWQIAAKADIAPGYQPEDAVWFNNRLYLGAQEGLWTLDAKAKEVVQLHEIETGAPNATNGGRLDLSPDGKYLLTAGPHGACLHDGTGWRRLFSSFDFL